MERHLVIPVACCSLQVCDLCSSLCAGRGMMTRHLVSLVHFLWSPFSLCLGAGFLVDPADLVPPVFVGPFLNKTVCQDMCGRLIDPGFGKPWICCCSADSERLVAGLAVKFACTAPSEIVFPSRFTTRLTPFNMVRSLKTLNLLLSPPIQAVGCRTRGRNLRARHPVKLFI